MNKKAINTVEKYNMLSKGDRVLVAVSGGADSMALLEFFISIKDKYDLNLCAAHIEHGIRAEESLSDALFVKEYCETFKNHIEEINFKNYEMSLPFETFLCHPNKDLEIFKHSYFEGIFDKENIFDYITNYINNTLV